MTEETWSRPSGRKADELRPIKITRHYTKYAEGSVLIEVGGTKVICTASVEEKVPGWLKDQGKGWVTAEYGMLPRATRQTAVQDALRLPVHMWHSLMPSIGSLKTAPWKNLRSKDKSLHFQLVFMKVFQLLISTTTKII